MVPHQDRLGCPFPAGTTSSAMARFGMRQQPRLKRSFAALLSNRRLCCFLICPGEAGSVAQDDIVMLNHSIVMLNAVKHLALRNQARISNTDQATNRFVSGRAGECAQRRGPGPGQPQADSERIHSVATNEGIHSVVMDERTHFVATWWNWSCHTRPIVSARQLSPAVGPKTEG